MTEDCDCPFDYEYTCPACGHTRITNHCPRCGWLDPGPGWASAARAAGWLPPGEIEFKVWRARNLNGDSCRWCGATRTPGVPGRPAQPHRPPCRFYDGPVSHAFKAGHFGTFGYWVYCTCGASYPEHDTEGNKQECPDRDLTWRHPKTPDLLADAPAAASSQPGSETAATGTGEAG